MTTEIELVGTFAEEERCVHAVEALRRDGIAFRVFSPIPSEHLLHAIHACDARPVWLPSS